MYPILCLINFINYYLILKVFYFNHLFCLTLNLEGKEDLSQGGNLELSE